MIRLAIRCSPELAEQVLAELLELTPSGIEESEADGYVEYAIYGPPGELPELPDLKAAAGDGLVSIETTEVADDWAERWRQFHKPVRVGDRLLVRPSWERDNATPVGRHLRRSADQSSIEIIIDPGRAFGTGSHATTWLCLEMLLGLADAGRAGGSLADLGTGSGVLAIAASKLGYRPVVGCDHEQAAVEIATANAAANGIKPGAAFSLERINLRERPGPRARTWVANLTAPLLILVAGRIRSLAESPEVAIVSGLLVAEVEPVSEAFAAAGMGVERVGEREGWAALQLTRR